MAAKINLSVPDDLQKRITALGISPSKLYQEAAKKRVEKEEALQKARAEQLPKGDAMQAIVNRLAKEKAQYEDQAFDRGEKEGLAFAQAASFNELKHAATVLADTCDLADRILTQDEVLGYYFDDLVSAGEELSERWLHGWASGVRAFWESLPANLKA